MRIGITLRVTQNDGSTISKTKSVKIDWRSTVAAAAVVVAAAVLLKR